VARAFTADDREGMRSLVERAVRRVFQPDAGVTLSGQPVRDFLAGSAPSNTWSRFQWEAGREGCRRWASGKGGGILPSRDAFMRDTCTPYITGAYSAPPAGSANPPFTGGQCSGVAYVVLRQNQLDTGPFGSPANSSGTGPVIGPYVDFDGSGVGRAGIEFASGKVQTLDGPASQVRAPTIISITRSDGGADTCGNPPTQYDPGAPVTGVPGPSPVPSPPGVPWPVPVVDITFNPDGTIGIDFGDDTPPVTIDPGEDDPAGGGTDPGEPEAGTPADTGDGGEAEGDAPPGKELWALRIAINSFPPRPNQYTDDVYRGVCYVYMGDSRGLDHDPAGAMLRSGQLVLAERDGLTKYRVTANLGYNLSVTPYWRTPGKLK